MRSFHLFVELTLGGVFVFSLSELIFVGFFVASLSKLIFVSFFDFPLIEFALNGFLVDPYSYCLGNQKRVRCRHLRQACCPLKDRPTAIRNGAQIQHHACANQYDSLLGEVSGWKWIDSESCTL